MFKIEKNVKRPTSTTVKKYPFEDMEVGDSFFVSADDPSKREKVRNSILGSGRLSRRAGTEMENWRFGTAIVDGGIRCWRIK